MAILKKDEAFYQMEPEGDMKVPAYIFATEKLLKGMEKDRTMWQLRNVASLEGVVKQAILLPDGHEGYGFPIGGVAAWDAEGGIVSPGGIGYDINCGVRMLTTQLEEKDVKPKIRELCDTLFADVPSGLGSRSQKLRVTPGELDEVVTRGVEWAVEKGYGRPQDIERTEEYGKIAGAEPSKVSDLAKKRGKSQIGTLGSGNHFLEVQVVDKIFDDGVAKKFGLREGMVTCMIHTGSRGFGHQICSDYLHTLMGKAQKLGLKLPDRELVYCPLEEQEAQDYLGAMRCAVNFAFTNRHTIMHWTRGSFDKVLGAGTGEKMDLVYDVAHNIAKLETHKVDGENRELIVHRKGATRAFPAGRPELPPMYKDVGQPVIIPGSMGTASYVLVGKERGLGLSWGSTCHGSGRTMSRKEATRTHRGDELVKGLWEKGIYVRATGMKEVAEEAPDAYKDVDEVVKAVADAGISDVVARVRPLGVVKG